MKWKLLCAAGIGAVPSRHRLPLGIAQFPLLCGFGKHWNPVVIADSPTSRGSTYAPGRSSGSGKSAFHFSFQSQLPNNKGNKISRSGLSMGVRMKSSVQSERIKE